MSTRANPAMGEWSGAWTMVVAAMLGFSLSTLATHSMGLFMEPLSREFGWNRAQISSGMAFYSIISIVMAMVAGVVIDRWGSRPIAIVGVILFAGAFASLGLTTGSLTVWLAQWMLFSVLAVGIQTAVWTTAVSSRFSAGRGLALALTLCGSSMTQILAPVITNQLIAEFGWRQAYFGLAAIWGGVALLAILFFFHDARSFGARQTTPSASAVLPAAMAGLSLPAALRSPRILRIAGAELLTSLVTVSIIVHIVPILQDGGIERSSAAAIAGSVGFAAIFGKLMTGWLLDRSQSSWIPMVSLWFPGAACLLLLDPARLGGAVLIAALIFGYGTGSYFQIVTYLTTRYAGLANFGKIFGLMAALMAVGAGAGPTIAGHVFDVTGSYDYWLMVSAAFSIVAGLLVFRLGAYPDWENADRARPASAPSAG